MGIYQPWDRLTECAVGSSYPPEYYEVIKNGKIRYYMEKIAQETCEDLDRYCSLLRGLGVKVIRAEISDDVEDHTCAIPHGSVTEKTRLPVPPPLHICRQMGRIGERFFMSSWGMETLKGEYITDRRNLHRDYVLEEHSMVGKPISIYKLAQCVDFPKPDFETTFFPWNPLVKHLEDKGVEIVYDRYINTSCTLQVGKDLYFNMQNMLNSENRSMFKKKLVELFPDHRCHLLDLEGHTTKTVTIVKPGLLITRKNKRLYQNTFPDWEIIQSRKMPNHLQIKQKVDRSYRRYSHGWWIPNNDQTSYEEIENFLKGWYEDTQGQNKYRDNLYLFSQDLVVVDGNNVIGPPLNNINKMSIDYIKTYGINYHECHMRHLPVLINTGLDGITMPIERESSEMETLFPDDHNPFMVGMNKHQSKTYTHNQGHRGTGK